MVSTGNRQEVLDWIRSGGRMHFDGGFVRMEISKAPTHRNVFVATMRVQHEVMLGDGLAIYEELTRWWRKYKSKINKDERLIYIVVALAWIPTKGGLKGIQ